MISDTYKELNRQLHETNPRYGISGKNYADTIRKLSMWGRLTILDYGSGKCTLSQALGPAYRVTDFDPCIEELSAMPLPHDVVVCTDVMEHVEPEFIKAVLDDIRGLTKRVAFFSISLVPAKKTLADGRNAHISLHPQSAWAEMLEGAGFTIDNQTVEDEEHNAWFIVS